MQSGSAGQWRLDSHAASPKSTPSHPRAPQSTPKRARPSGCGLQAVDEAPQEPAPTRCSTAFHRQALREMSCNKTLQTASCVRPASGVSLILRWQIRRRRAARTLTAPAPGLDVASTHDREQFTRELSFAPCRCLPACADGGLALKVKKIFSISSRSRSTRAHSASG